MVDHSFYSIWNMLPSVRGFLGRALSASSTSPSGTTPHTPTYEDVCVVRAMLNTLNLPTELVLEILDYARYWPSVEFSMDASRTAVAHAGIDNPSCATLCFQADIFQDPVLGSLANCKEKLRVKEIEFEMESCDQGWTSEGTQFTFNTSSWIEVAILRGIRSHDTLLPANFWDRARWRGMSHFQESVREKGWWLVERPSHLEFGAQDSEGHFAWYLQGNRVAKGSTEIYRVVWGEDWFEGNEGARDGEGFIKELKDGDRVLVWARAKWPGWACLVYSINMKVSYGF